MHIPDKHSKGAPFAVLPFHYTIRSPDCPVLFEKNYIFMNGFADLPEK